MLRAFAIAALLSGLTFGQTFEVASVKKNTTGERPSADGKGDRLNIYNLPLKFIVAKPAPNVSRDTLFVMLQNLLAERFKLTIRREQKLMPVYALVVARNGPKLQPSAPGSNRRTPCTPDGRQLTCQSQKSTMADLAQNLPRWVSMNWFDPPALSLLDALQEQLGLKLEQQKTPVDRIVIDHAERLPVEN
jgi:hypothetical protein